MKDDVLLSDRQHQVLDSNYRACRPLYGTPSTAIPRTPVRKIAYVGPHSLVDFTNGAATATLDGLRMLARQGFECQAFCGTWIDARKEVSIEQILEIQGKPCERRHAQIGPYQGQMVFSRQGEVPLTFLKSQSSQRRWADDREAAAFLTGCELFLTRNRPDVVWTYGGDPICQEMHRLIKRLDISILFAVHNFAYRNPQTFDLVDTVIVPSDFSRQYYWERMGLACHVLPLVIDEGRVTSGHNLRQYLTFVNPEPRKGVHVFARIAEVLATRRPDIPMLLVEGAVQATGMLQYGIDLSGIKSLHVMPNTSDPREFYARTKLLLMPSLWGESFGLVAAEAMLNGIPVLASDRGPLPSTIADAGFAISVPARYNEQSQTMPTVSEIEEWVRKIEYLWDDAIAYATYSQKALERARQWLPETLTPYYCDFFSKLAPQPGPPLVPPAT